MNRQDGAKQDGWRSLYGDEPLDNRKRSEDTTAENNLNDVSADTAAGAEPVPAYFGSDEGGSARAGVEEDIPPPIDSFPGGTARLRPDETQHSGSAVADVRPPGDPRPAPRRKPRVMLWSFFIALGLVLATIGGTLVYVWNGLRPPAAMDHPVRVTIDKGMRASKVAALLEQKGLIRNAFLFGGWMKLKGEGARFQAGEYDLQPGLTREQIVGKLNAGDIVAAATFKFTVPEGYTVQQMAERLAKTGNVNKVAFLQAVADPSKWAGSSWTAQIPKDKQLLYPLEGYLFPETYAMASGSNASDVVNRMLGELDNKLGQLPEDWQTTLQQRGLTVHQLLTIASLVEREVVVDEERPIVAGVIANRLKQRMPLQIDATIQYLLEKPKEQLVEADLKVNSPYNTYLNPGLPPGPIASPSLKSIQAALYPADTQYMYYVTKKDGSNSHLFAITFKQHQKNIQLSERNAKK